MIKLEHLSKEYLNSSEDKTRYGVFDINLEFPNTGLYVIEGKSGCGKTTLLNILGCIDNYDQGSYQLNCNEIKYLKVEDIESIRANYYSFIFQDYRLFDELTIFENITYNCKDKEKCNRTYVSNLAYKLGIKCSVKKECKNLSGGEKQRVAIARALIKNPKVILADEPTGNLDSVTSVEVMNILKEESKDKLIIMVSHNHELAAEYADKIIKMSDGHITEIIDNKKEQEVFQIAEPIEEDKPNFGEAYGKIRKILGRNLKNNILFGLLDSCLLIFLLLTISLFSYSETNATYESLVASGETTAATVHYEYENDGHYYDYTSGGYFAKNHSNILGYPSVEVTSSNAVVEKYTNVYLSNVRYANNLELVDGNYPTQSDQIVVSDYLYARNSRASTITLDGVTYTISGIYKTSYTGLSSVSGTYKDYAIKAFYGLAYFYGDYDVPAFKTSVSTIDPVISVANFSSEKVIEVKNISSNATSLIFGKSTLAEDEVVISSDYYNELKTKLSLNENESFTLENNNDYYDFSNVAAMEKYSLSLDMNSSLKVVGVINNAGSGKQIFINDNVYKNVANTYSTYFGYNQIFRSNVSSSDDVKKMLECGYSFDYYFTDIVANFTLYIDVFRYLGLILSIMLFVIVLLMMVKDFKNLFINKRQHIGVMLTLGVHKQEIVYYIALHYAITELTGLVVASCATIGIIAGVNGAFIDSIYVFKLLAYPWLAVIVGFVVVVGIAVLLAYLGFRKLKDNRVSSWMKNAL